MGIRKKIDDNFLDKIDNTKAWFIGLMASDGHINKSNGTCSIGQSNIHGRKIINYLKKILKFKGNIYTYLPKNGDFHYSITFTSNKIKNELARYNIINNKSLTYKFPELLSKEYLISFLRGYIDGDGCVTISKNKKGCQYLNINFVGTKEFMDKCKILIPFDSKVRKINRATNCFEIRFYGQKAIAFGNWLYQDTNLFKSNKFLIFNKNCKKQNRWDTYNHKRIKVKQLIDNGYSILKIAKELEISFQSIYKWKKQNKI